MRAEVLYGKKALEFVTKTKGPEIRVRAGGSPIVFNERMLSDHPEELHPWARRWEPVLQNPDAYVANSVLDKREWAVLDREIYEMVKLRLKAVEDLRSRGLWSETSLAEMLSQWRVSSERIRPTVSMDGRSRADRDRTDRKTFSVPIPMYRTDYDFGARELLASRQAGAPLDTHEAGQAARSVAEEMERMLFNGESGIVVEGNTIYGYTTHSGRDTGAATAYGGGDFGTEGNANKTILGMMAALAGKRYHGPFMVYVALAQYHEILEIHSDGSGQTEKARIEMLDEIEEVKACDFLAAGNTVMVQMTSDVVDWREGQGIQNREWSSPDKQAEHFAVIAAGAPRLKVNHEGDLAVAHATGC